MTTRVEFVWAGVKKADAIVEGSDEPFTLCIVLDVFGKAPKDPIDVIVTWSPIWQPPVDEFELGEFEVEALQTIGRHAIDLPCVPPNFVELAATCDPTTQTALIVSLQYKEREFLLLGFSVDIRCDLQETPEEFTDPTFAFYVLTVTFKMIR
ncbi:anti-silencing protein a-like protein, putative [Bodo saltans]|uniref:Anti-silencing protein a-like protein, putative n=1 Tax=Bodo saltans TaxID=75058 RepID=A0A0S4JN61_BODSA|nr:anti-silencing protein a-like protein, putative [Bodo saltans]|eukprot:CUG91580.1 anti-silencing protein a-like protein, putative [Bodo saltans]